MISSGLIGFRFHILAIASMLALAACNNDSGSDAGRDDHPGQLPGDINLPLKPGKWQKNVSFTQINVPSLGTKKKQDIMTRMSKAASKTFCLSPDLAARPPADFFGAGVKGACKYRGFSYRENKAEIELSCAMEGMAMADMQLSGNIAAEHLGLDVTSDLRLPMIGKVELKGRSESRFLGAC
jgi:Protein of unknown function (DUF3617)